MSSSFLDDSYLGSLGNSEISIAPTVAPEGARAPQRLPAPAQPDADVVRLPGGIVMPRQTFYVIALAVVAVAVYTYFKRKKD